MLFSYTLIPTYKMLHTILVRQSNKATPPLQSIVQFSRYPFVDFPQIESHVPPEFMMLKAGAEIDRMVRAPQDGPDRHAELREALKHIPGYHRHHLRKITEIYNTWTQDPPDGFDTDSTRPLMGEFDPPAQIDDRSPRAEEYRYVLRSRGVVASGSRA